MTILAIDDEPVMLAHLETELRKVFPKADIVTFDECDEVLAFLETPQSRSLHYAFMDIKLRGMLGIELAKRIKDQCPQTRILFCTSYSYYALEAYQLHALGYLMKPVDAVNSYAGEYMNNYSWAELTNARLYNGTFSDFVLAAQARSRR